MMTALLNGLTVDLPAGIYALRVEDDPVAEIAARPRRPAPRPQTTPCRGRSRPASAGRYR